MSSAEAVPVDVGRLAEQADAQRDRLLVLLAEGCARLAPGRPALEVARELVRVHPGAQGVIDAGRLWAQRAIDFTREHDLVPYHDGVCLLGPAPESRRYAFAEGWAHCAEELCVEEGFGADDPRLVIGVWLEALVRVTRLACAIGVHTAGMTVEQAARRFGADTCWTSALPRSASSAPRWSEARLGGCQEGVPR